MPIINPKYTEPAGLADLASKFQNADPYPYLICEDFLDEDIASSLYDNFPQPENLNVKRKSLNENKSEDYHFERFHPDFTKVREALNSDAFNNAISAITGIDGLFSTQDGFGSGVHQGPNGSFVDVHVDFNMHTEKNLHRRVNMLLYLNKDWSPEYGGDLELWDTDVKNCVASVTPKFNRAVIFETSDISYHGVKKVTCPEGNSRKSFYAYYYTPIGKDFVYRDSRFKSRPDEGKLKSVITETKETLKVNVKRILKKLGVSSLDFQDKN